MRESDINFHLYEAPLNASNLLKYRGTKRDRVPTFLQKIKDKSSFKALIKGQAESVVIDPDEYTKVVSWLENPTSPLMLKLEDGRTIPLGNIVKTPEFGGEASFSREKIEQGQIGDIQQQLEAVKAGAPFVMLKVGNETVRAAAVEKEKSSVNGRAPKSDMTVLDDEGREVAWVSLKGLPEFRWGGWSHFIHHPQIKEWIARIKEVAPAGLQSKMAFRLTPPDEIIYKIIYGKDFGGSFGPSNVNVALIGDVSIENGVLTATRVYTNGDKPSGSDEPYLVVRYMSNRNDVMKNSRAETNTSSDSRSLIPLDTEADVEAAKARFSA